MLSSEELGAIRDRAKTWPKQSLATLDRIALLAECDRLRALLSSIKACVDEQAEDPALWIMYPTIGEAYLQKELRRLHAVIEGEVFRRLRRRRGREQR